jgi:stage III sporulation protein AG
MAFWENLTGKKKSFFLIIVGMIGVAMIVFGSTQEKENKNLMENSDKNDATLEYIMQIENKISNITEQITGSSHVRVIVSVASGSEFLYVSNEEIKENFASKEYVTVRTEGGADLPILLKEIYPEIVGISVACKGGDSPEVQAKLIRVISTTYGISSNRICIVGIP